MENGTIRDYSADQERAYRMKSRTLFLGFVLVTALLAGCGGSSNTKLPGESCLSNADCDDGDFCSGIERCVQGICDQTPRCDDKNPCTTNECVDTGAVQTCRSSCTAAGPSDACCGNAACSDAPMCIGETYEFQVTELTQESPPCPFSQAMLDAILVLLGQTSYNVQLPPPDSVFTTVEIELPIPILGTLTVTATKVGGELVFAPVAIEGIDLGQYDFPVAGLNCLVGGTASGSTDGFGQDSVQVNIQVTNMSVTEGSGEGPCSLTVPSPDPPSCTLQAVSEGTRLLP
jgi:hypothetical protein